MTASFLTESGVAALAPDPASLSAAAKLVGPGRWLTQGRSERLLWGECPGGGSQPYRAAVDLSGPAFKCSCPSRKFPCKHALALMLGAVRGHAAAGEAPDWAAEWAYKRDGATARKAAEPGAPKADPEAAAKRAAKRETAVAAGIEGLAAWLSDAARDGLAELRRRPEEFFARAAARMVDAQAPGLAEHVRRLREELGRSEGWEDAAADRLARMHLLVESWRHQDRIPEPLRNDVRLQIGWPVVKDEILQLPAHKSVWTVLGRAVEENEQIVAWRSWLISAEGRFALVVDHAHVKQRQTLPVGLVPGAAFRAELCHVPSAVPLRAVIRTLADADAPPRPFGESVAEAARRLRAAASVNPWIDAAPVLIEDALLLGPPSRPEAIADPDGARLPLVPGFRGGPLLAALSGGRPVPIFAELRVDGLLPLCAWDQDDRLIPLEGL